MTLFWTRVVDWAGLHQHDRSIHRLLATARLLAVHVCTQAGTCASMSGKQSRPPRLSGSGQGASRYWSNAPLPLAGQPHAKPPQLAACRCRQPAPPGHSRRGRTPGAEARAAAHTSAGAGRLCHVGGGTKQQRSTQQGRSGGRQPAAGSPGQRMGLLASRCMRPSSSNNGGRRWPPPVAPARRRHRRQWARLLPP